MSERSDRRRRQVRPGARPDIEDILKGMNWEARMEEARAKRARVLAAKARFEPGTPNPATFDNPETPALINEMSDPLPDVPEPKPDAPQQPEAKPAPFVLTRDHAAPTPARRSDTPVLEERAKPPVVRAIAAAAPAQVDVNHPRPIVAPKRFAGRPRPEVEALIAPKRPPRKRRRMAPLLVLGLGLGAGAAYLGANRLDTVVAGFGTAQLTGGAEVPAQVSDLAPDLDYPVRAGWPAAPRPAASALALPQPSVQTIAPLAQLDLAPPVGIALPSGEAPIGQEPGLSRLVAHVPATTPRAEALGALALAVAPDPPAAAEVEPVVLAPDNGTAPTSLPPISLRLSVPTGVPQQRLAEVTSALNAAGYQPDSATRVGYAVSQDHVRYYHPEDAEAASRIAQALGGPARDFTSFTPPPRLGTLEAFLAGSAPQPDQNNPLEDIEAVLQSLFQRIQLEDAGANAGN